MGLLSSGQLAMKVFAGLVPRLFSTSNHKAELSNNGPACKPLDSHQTGTNPLKAVNCCERVSIILITFRFV